MVVIGGNEENIEPVRAQTFSLPGTTVETSPVGILYSVIISAEIGSISHSEPTSK
jgi:hypothetical protein